MLRLLLLERAIFIVTGRGGQIGFFFEFKEKKLNEIKNEHTIIICTIFAWYPKNGTIK
jgi:hypothetical protein